MQDNNNVRASLEGKVAFTIKEESNHQIAFLDTLVSRKGNAIIIDVYRKPTHTDCYLDFFSHHDQRQKISTAEALLQYTGAQQGILRTLNLAMSPMAYDLKTILQTLSPNTIPTHEELACLFFKWSTRQEHSSSYAILSFINGITQSLTRILQKHATKVINNPFKTLQEEFPSPKFSVRLASTN